MRPLHQPLFAFLKLALQQRFEITQIIPGVGQI
jgi:hypothetical protein